MYFDLDCPVEMPDETPRASSLETNLSNIFSKAGKPFSKNKYIIEALKHKVDHWIEYDGKTILIEADGHYHFTKRLNPETGRYETGRYNGNTILQSTLIEKYMPDDAILLRVPFEIVNTLRQVSQPLSEEQQEELYGEAIDALLDDTVLQGTGRHMPDEIPSRMLVASLANGNGQSVRSIRKDVWHLVMAA